MSRIVLLTAGSRGDVQPYVALGVGLSQAGHRVRIATHVGFRNLVEEHGLDFAPVAKPTSALTSSKLWQRWQRSGGNVAAYVLNFLRIARRARSYITTMLDDFWNACQGSDLILSSTSAVSGPQMAARLGVPHVWALFQPMSRTYFAPHLMTPQGRDLGPHLNRWTYSLAELVYWWLFAPALNPWLENTLDCRPLRRNHAGTFLGERPGAILYGFSHHIFPRPADWSDNTYISGFWNLKAAHLWEPPRELAAFLDSGTPPIYFYLTGIKYSSSEKLLSMVVDVLHATGQRGLLYIEPGATELIDLPPSALRVGPIPHDWLFPLVPGVVHHGGPGTVSSAWHAGKPAVSVPGFWDQQFWSRRVHSLGTGPKPVPARSLNRVRLAEAITLMMSDPTYTHRAVDIGKKLAEEDGVKNAVAVVEHLLNAPTI